VGLEGLRELLHLNPHEFDANDDVLEHLQHVVNEWTNLGLQTNTSDIDVDLLKTPNINGYTLKAKVTNLGARADRYSCSLEIPAPIVTERNVWVEVHPAHRHGYRRFEITERGAVHDNSGGSQGPITKGASKDFFGIAVAINQIPKGNRKALLDNPIYISAELDGRTQDATIPINKIFDLADLDY